MGEYQRTTRETTFDALDPVLRAGLQAHIEKHELGDIAGTISISCETASTRRKQGLLGGKPETILSSAMVTPGWLLWATRRNNEAAAVMSARLRDIRVQDYEKTESYKLIQDSRLVISRLRTDAVDLGSVFIGLGPEPAAAAFRDALKAAVAGAEP
jgi:hypothetical protein